jgi:beta-glucuronidase
MPRTFLFIVMAGCVIPFFTTAQTFIANAPARRQTSLNGKWQAIIDPVDCGIGSWKAIYKDKKPIGKTDFYEYSFEGGPVFDVPGDVNSQMPELKFYESTVWYKKTVELVRRVDRRLFLYFDGANYETDVFLNSEKIGGHEGGFTPFQFEITGNMKEGKNTIIVRVNNARKNDAVPGMGYDWLNYGGITRDVRLIETPQSYIDDYLIQLEKGSKNIIGGYVQMAGAKSPQKLRLRISEAKIDFSTRTNAEGRASIRIPAKLKLWTPSEPKLYTVQICSETDTVVEKIGFRSIEIEGQDILLNGEPVFLKGVNFHEEVPQRKGRACSESDALMLLTWAKDLGCNFIRTAHYPQNEYIVRMAEKMGLMVWEEIPVWQSIEFGNPATVKLIETQMKEMLRRDKNRCGIVIWSVSNETRPEKERDQVLSRMARLCRTIDNTRLVSSAFNNVKSDGKRIAIEDTLIQALDVIGVNEYLGWYKPWPAPPEDMEWTCDFNKPLIMSEFGGEALYGNHGPADVASSWSEEYQEQLYRDQLTMMKKIPFLRGCCPWILADFQSLGRLHPVFQGGWNRKGLLSDKGDRKKAWFVMKEFYSKK